MKQKIFLLACCLLSIMMYSQSEQKAFSDWQTNEGTQNFFHKNVTRTDGSGNVYVAGATNNVNGTTDILLAKYNSSGIQQWIVQYNGTANFHDFATGLHLDGNDGVYITGAVCNDDVNFTTDLIVMKYDEQGSHQWTYTYDNGSSLHDSGKDIVVDVNGYVFVTGASYNSNLNTDVVTLSLDDAGSELWVRTYDYASELDDAGYKMELKGSDLIVVGPVTSSFNDFRIVTLEYDASSGSLNADNTSSAVSTSSVEIVSDLVTDASGNIYICGATQISGQAYNYFTAKLSSSLTIVWQQTYNGASNLDDLAKGIKVDASGNVYVTGYSTSSTQGRDILTIKYNSSGTQQWLQTLNSSVNGDDEVFAMVIDNSSNIYVTGSTASDINAIDYYTVKYNSSGAKIWDIQTDGHHLNDRATHLALDNSGNVIVTGQSETEPNVFEYITEKYLQKDIITPTDFNGETPNNNYRYYANQGQLITTTNTAVPNVKFYTHNTYPAFYFKDNSLSMVFSRIDTVITTSDTLHRIDLNFTNSYENAKTYPLEQKRDGYLNYFLDNTGSDGVSGVFGNERIVTPNLYNNIDLMSSSNENGIKYYFIVKPGGDLRDIKFDFTGATSFSLNGTTNALSINSSIGSITFDRPTVYQLTSANATVAVTGWTADWQTDGASNKYKFNDGVYTSSLTLVIQVDQGNGIVSSTSSIGNLDWSTYYGGAGGEDVGHSIKNDNTGSIYVGGYSTNASFPTTAGAYQSTYLTGDVSNGILMKFNSSRQRQWSTYYGGGNYEEIKSITYDNFTAQIYAVGLTMSSDFPIKNKTGANVSGTFGGNTDAFVASFNPTGNLTWSNLIGTSGDERGFSVCSDNSGNKYLTGYTSTGLTLQNAASFYMQNTYGGGSSDGFIAKFNSTDQLRWLTYYGGNAEDYPKSIITDVNGNVIVWGQTGSTSFNTYNPGGGAVYTTTNSGSTDFFIAKFNSSGTRLWATLYGGNGDDWAADSDGIITVGDDIYCFGTTFSTNLPIQQYSTTATYNLNGAQDCYIVCFNSSYQKKWATYFGSSYEDFAGGITKDINNNIFITGSTANNDYSSVTPSGFYTQSFQGPTGLPSGQFQGGDAFVTAFSNSNLAPVWSTFIGGSKNEGGNSISTTSTKLFITGETTTSNTSTVLYPVVMAAAGAYTYSPGSSTGGGDIFISEFNILNMGIATGTNENSESNFDVNIYPNPFTNNINIQGLKEIALIEIFDITGKLILCDKTKSEENSVNLSILSSGVYLLKVINENGDYKTYKIIKNN